MIMTPRKLSRLAMVPGLLCVSFLAQAADALTVNITGDILEPTNCTYDLASSSIDMGRIEALDFSGPGVGATTSWQDLNIKSTGCHNTITDMDWAYTASADDIDPTLFKVTGAAEGVGLELALIDASGSQISILPNTTHNWLPRVPGDEYKHVVRYKKTKRLVVNGVADTTIVVLITNHYI